MWTLPVDFMKLTEGQGRLVAAHLFFDLSLALVVVEGEEEMAGDCLCGRIWLCF